MALTINPVSCVSFKSQNIDSIDDFLSRPGAFSRPEQIVLNDPAPKKKHSFLKAAAGILVAAGVAAGALVGLHKGFPKVFDAAKSLEGLEGMKKFNAYITTGIAKAAQAIESGASWVVDSCNNGWKSIASKFKKK